jgi:HSP20 family molecular chaperone IbpA
MFPILTDDFLNSFADEFRDFLRINDDDSLTCSCGENCKCKKTSYKEDTNKNEPILYNSYREWESNGGKYTKSIALPCSKENVSIHVIDGKKLTIDYEETISNESDNSFEKHTFSGSITFVLPQDADETTLSAKFKDNFLNISVEKFPSQNVNPTRKIDIK